MARVKEFDWKMRDELKSRRSKVKTRIPIFSYKICAVCGDAVRFERMWKVQVRITYDYKFICQGCSSSWEEAYDKGQSDQYRKQVYKTAGY